MTWFRVEFDAEGKRVSCKAAPATKEDDNVFYVQAGDVEAAWRKAHSLRVRVLQRKLAEERKAAGKCPRCGVGKYDGTTRCVEYCKPEETKRQRNVRTITAVTPATQLREVETHLTRDERLRLTILQECLAAWRSPRNFLTWITGEIDALTTKIKKAS